MSPELEQAERERADREHEMLRTELIAHEASRINIVAIAGSGVAVVLGLAMSAGREPLDRGFIALAALGAVWPSMLLIASRVRSIARITAYMRIFLEPVGSYEWETRLDDLRKQSPSGGSGSRRWSSWRTIVPGHRDLGGWGGIRDVSPLLVLASMSCVVSAVSFFQAGRTGSVWGWVFFGAVAVLLFLILFRGSWLAGLSSPDEMRERYESAWRAQRDAGFVVRPARN